MANMSVFYEIAKHATANPSNGNLVAIGDWMSLDLFAEAAATTFTGKIVEKMGNGNYLVLVENPGDACLVYQVPVGAEEWTNSWKRESNLYNKAGDVVRVYGLVKHDRFEVSAEGFDGEPAVGAEITGVANKKMVVG